MRGLERRRREMSSPARAESPSVAGKVSLVDDSWTFVPRSSAIVLRTHGRHPDTECPPC